jgi:transposase-like protein/tetratricopeptide (TPR) repeat protein
MLHKTGTEVEAKIMAVKDYLAGGRSYRQTAARHNVPSKTLWFWVRAYRTGGLKALERRPGKIRVPEALTQKIIFMKEKDPGLTILDAARNLGRGGDRVSKNTIWRIWRGSRLIRRPLDQPFTTFGAENHEIRTALARASHHLSRGNAGHAAEILNRLSYLSQSEILMEIPDAFLSPRRKLDKLFLQVELRFENTSFSEFSRMAKSVGRDLERRGCRWSSMLANFLELIALTWLGRPLEKLKVHARLLEKMKGVRDPVLRFNFYHQFASTYLDLMMVKPALDAIKKCRRLLCALPNALSWESFGDLLSRTLKNLSTYRTYRKAERYARDPAVRDRLNLKIAGCLAVMGNYPECKRYLKLSSPMKNSTVFGGSYCLASAYYHFGCGDVFRARDYYMNALARATRDQIHNRLIASSIGLAAIAMALNQPSEAKIHLTKYLSLTKKYKMYREAMTIRSLAGLASGPENATDMELPRVKLFALLRTAQSTMKTGEYRKVLDFAARQGYTGYLIQHIVFYPELVLNILRQGRATGLPTAVLRLPLFRQETPVYHIKFLGRVVVVKNGKYLPAHLSPKERAFLIHLALRAGAAGKHILLDDLLRNFWPNSARAADVLSHFLFKLKRKIRLPGHLLKIESRSGPKRLVNSGLYLTTDHDEFQTLLSQTRSLILAGEHSLAKREYLRAFRLFRGPLFKGLFDPWSEQTRNMILNQTESEFPRFRELCSDHAGTAGMDAVEHRLKTITPYLTPGK